MSNGDLRPVYLKDRNYAETRFENTSQQSSLVSSNYANDSANKAKENKENNSNTLFL